MTNVFERLNQGAQSQYERPMEVNFPLHDKDVINLIKGTEYTQIVTVSGVNQPARQLRIKVFSADRVKHISWENWIKIVSRSFGDPELEAIIREIQND